jgi:hypothetical protein
MFGLLEHPCRSLKEILMNISLEIMLLSSVLETIVNLLLLYHHPIRPDRANLVDLVLVAPLAKGFVKNVSEGYPRLWRKYTGKRQ